MGLKSTTFGLLNKLEHALGTPRPNVVVLNYKDVSINNFVEQINYLEKSDYEFITASEVTKYVKGEKKINKLSVAITFDNNSEILDFAKAFLSSRQIPATAFFLAHVIADLPDNWELGCHSLSLKLLDNPLVHYRKEIISSKKILESRNYRPVNVFSYPEGKYNKYALKNVRKAGYLGAFTTKEGLPSLRSNPFLINRINIKKDHSLEEFKSAFSQWRNLYWFLCRIFDINVRHEKPISNPGLNMN